MKVGLITTWQTECGLAEYAKNLVECSEGVEFKIISFPLSFDHIVSETEGVDLIHFNYSSGWFNEVRLNEWQKFRKQGKPTMLTFHDSSDDMVMKIAPFGLFDKIVVHKKAATCEYPDNVVVIPQPVRVVDVSGIPVYSKIGTAGFPFPWKGFDRAAFAAHQLGVKFLAIMADSAQVNALIAREIVLGFCPTAEIIVDWLPYDAIVRRLAECAMTVFDYDTVYQQLPLNGISAGVRFGIAARRPVIVSRCKMFDDLLDYPDEIYVSDDVLGVTIIQVFKDILDGCVKLPKRILEDMSWDRCAKLYLGVYKELYDFKQNDERGRLSGTSVGRPDSTIRMVRDGDVVAKAGV